MMLIILDKDPYIAANLVPDKIKFKQLLELGQLICSAGISSVYKPIKQGVKLQEWVNDDKNIVWVLKFFSELKKLCYYKLKLNLKYETKLKIETLQCHLINEIYDRNIKRFTPITTAILRYKEGYECKYPTNTELPIEECISEYEKYCVWKGWK